MIDVADLRIRFCIRTRIRPRSFFVDQQTIVRVLMTERDRLFAYIWSILGDVHLSEDVLQELTVVAMEKASNVSNELALVAWLRKAARLKAMEAIRGQKRQPAALDEAVLDQLEQHWSQFDQAKSTEMVEALRRCVHELSPNAKKLIKMRYVDAMKSGEIAELLSRNVTAVYQALTRTHRFLARCIEHKLG